MIQIHPSIMRRLRPPARSECSVSCGSGLFARERKILQAAADAGFGASTQRVERRVAVGEDAGFGGGRCGRTKK